MQITAGGDLAKCNSKTVCEAVYNIQGFCIATRMDMSIVQSAAGQMQEVQHVVPYLQELLVQSKCSCRLGFGTKH